jgi:hypothetical protein
MIRDKIPTYNPSVLSVKALTVKDATDIFSEKSESRFVRAFSGLLCFSI